jgi:hypothetical protein
MSERKRQGGVRRSAPELRRIPWGGPGPDPLLADETEPPEPPKGQPTWRRPERFTHKRAGEFKVYAIDSTPVPYGATALLPTRYVTEPLRRRGRGEPHPPPPRAPIALEIDASTGEPRCIAIRALADAELTGEMLRTVPIGELVDQATYALTRPVKPRRVAPDLWVYGYDELAKAMSTQQGRGSRTPRERLERVAAIYKEAKQNGDPPTNAVAEKLPCSRPQAGRLVTLTRQLGMIGPP